LSLQLTPLSADADIERLAVELSPGFGGEVDAARALLKANLDLLSRVPRPDPWGCYLAWDDGRAVGACAFKSAPDEQGVVEIAYMTFPAFERRGHAGNMIAALTGIARTAGAPLVIAHTLPVDNASNSALRRNHYSFAGEVTDPEDGLVWRWERAG
jgi:RimJ/RimL family protein N-acetyltransferase